MDWPIAADEANRRAAPKAPTGDQRPMIIAASPMKPRPAVMPCVNEPVTSNDRKAPPSAAMAPATMTLR